MGCDLSARQEKVEGRYCECRGCRPFLDRPAKGKPGEQRKNRPHQAENEAGDERHVEAGDRQDVREPRDPVGLGRLLGDAAPVAGDERVGDLAGIARKGRLDPAADPLAEILDRDAPADRPWYRTDIGAVGRTIAEA
jgi:hypothetical protein